MSTTKIPHDDVAPLKHGNSDLMNRLQSFLPKMADANQELESKIEEGKTQGSNPLQIDSLLHKDNEEKNVSDNSSECSGNQEDGNTSTSGKQIIEMTVALGNLESNPIMELLANDDEHEGDELDNKDVVQENNSNSEVIDLLGKRTHHIDTQGAETDGDKPLFTVRSTRRK